MEKLLVLVSIGQRAYGRWLFQRLLSGIILIFGLIITTSVLLSALLIGSIYAVYAALLRHGISHLMSMCIAGAVSVVVIILLSIVILLCVQHLRQMPRKLLKQSPLTCATVNTLDDFLKGFMKS